MNEWCRTTESFLDLLDPDWNVAMTMHTSPIPTNLAQVAASGDLDPCDVAEMAMPDLVLGDLSSQDAAWVKDHCATCAYCAGIRASFEDVCTGLDACEEQRIQPLVDQAKPRPAPDGLLEAGFGFMESPVGDILLAVSDDGVVEISYLGSFDRTASLREIERRGYLVRERQAAVQPVVHELKEYFASERKAFNLPVDLRGVSDFTRSVLEATERVPYGAVQRYGDIARAIGRPKASRAVGNALGKNPVPIIIPCHRVVLSSGEMGWYTGGPHIKQVLLGIEGAALPGAHVAFAG